jgi:hypothetical protein
MNENQMLWAVLYVVQLIGIWMVYAQLTKINTTAQRLLDFLQYKHQCEVPPGPVPTPPIPTDAAWRVVEERMQMIARGITQQNLTGG